MVLGHIDGMIESPMSSAAFTHVVSPTTLSISLLCAVNTAPDAGFFIYAPRPRPRKKKQKENRKSSRHQDCCSRRLVLHPPIPKKNCSSLSEMGQHPTTNKMLNHEAPISQTVVY
jgi:hypothetical protein